MTRNDESGRAFAIGDAVRFKEKYLIARPDQETRFAGRVGKVTGYRMGATDPIVEFPKNGRRVAQKLFEVPTESLEIFAVVSVDAER